MELFGAARFRAIDRAIGGQKNRTDRGDECGSVGAGKLIEITRRKARERPAFLVANGDDH